jgi:hypothetical protein
MWGTPDPVGNRIGETHRDVGNTPDPVGNTIDATHTDVGNTKSYLEHDWYGLREELKTQWRTRALLLFSSFPVRVELVETLLSSWPFRRALRRAQGERLGKNERRERNRWRVHARLLFLFSVRVELVETLLSQSRPQDPWWRAADSRPRLLILSSPPAPNLDTVPTNDRSFPRRRWRCSRPIA